MVCWLAFLKNSIWMAKKSFSFEVTIFSLKKSASWLAFSSVSELYLRRDDFRVEIFYRTLKSYLWPVIQSRCTLIQMLNHQVSQNIILNQMNKIIDFPASGVILIREGIQNDRAVDVDVFAEGVVLEDISGINDRVRHIFLLLLCFFLKEIVINL